MEPTNLQEGMCYSNRCYRNYLHERTLVVKTNGKEYPTISDAVVEFGVAAKTVYGWIERGVISAPPTLENGLRTIKIFPKSYMKKAMLELKRYRDDRNARAS